VTSAERGLGREGAADLGPGSARVTPPLAGATEPPAVAQAYAMTTGDTAAGAAATDDAAVGHVDHVDVAPPAGASHAGPIARVLLVLIRFYQRWISPALPPRCRFYPTCSAYAAEALRVHGAARGTWLAVVRIAKCQPFHAGGVDRVPPRRARGAH
jgi:hypothetical protein